MKEYVIGVDYGTDSVRATVVNTANGEELGSCVHYYERWKQGKFCDPRENRFRQHPMDYIEGLEASVKGALKETPPGTAEKVAALSIDTTGSTPVAVNREGIPLALTPPFVEDPDAMFILWKDHTALGEAQEINEKNASWGGQDYSAYEGGIYSSEWFWAKILHILRNNEKVRQGAFSWVEHCDWIPALLTGDTDPLKIKRSRCAAGHKAMWHESWDGLPSEEFLRQLDPLLEGLRDRLYTKTYTSDVSAGTLCAEWAEKLGLPQNVSVGVGAFDAHMGAVGGEIAPYSMVKVMGTSTCDIVVAPMKEVKDTLVKGICGQVDGSVVPGMLGLEAGQSAFGDVYAWFKQLLAWPVVQTLERLKSQPGKDSTSPEITVLEDMLSSIIPALSEAAEDVPPGSNGLTALDWLNGRRTPDADQRLKGAVKGLSLGTDAPALFRALVEATAYGSRKIAERFESEGVEVKEVIAIGGVAKKSDLVMQITADVMNRTIKVAKSDQSVALGAAMFAAVHGGVYGSVAEAQKGMGQGFSRIYTPDPERVEEYDRLYREYEKLGAFIEESVE